MAFLEKKTHATPAKSVNISRLRLVKAWSEIDQDTFCVSVEDFPHSLRALIKAKGDLLLFYKFYLMVVFFCIIKVYLHYYKGIYR